MAFYGISVNLAKWKQKYNYYNNFHQQRQKVWVGVGRIMGMDLRY